MSTWLPIWPNKRTEMNEIAVANKAADWHRLKALVLDSVSSPITKRVYNLGLNEFFAWYGQEPRPGFTKATVSAWRVALEARGLGSVSINVRITAVRKLAVEAADNGLLAPELAAGITRVKGVASKGVRLGNWLSASVPSPARTELLRRAAGGPRPCHRFYQRADHGGAQTGGGSRRQRAAGARVGCRDHAREGGRVQRSPLGQLAIRERSVAGTHRVAQAGGWRPAALPPILSTCGSRRCANWRWKPPTTGCWRPSWLPGSRA